LWLLDRQTLDHDSGEFSDRQGSFFNRFGQPAQTIGFDVWYVDAVLESDYNARTSRTSPSVMGVRSTMDDAVWNVTSL
jgi:hypothetical protein